MQDDLNCVDVPSFFGSGLEDSHVPTFLLLPHVGGHGYDDARKPIMNPQEDACRNFRCESHGRYFQFRLVIFQDVAKTQFA